MINVGKFKVLTGKDVSEEIYLKTWELDNETFEEKDKITKDKALEWFYSSDRSIIVLWNEEDQELVGYLYPFLLKHEFARDYILSNMNYKEAIKPSVFCKKKRDVSADIYIFSTVIKSKYRDVILEDKVDSAFNNKKAFKVLNEKLVEYIYDLKKNNVEICYMDDVYNWICSL